MEEKRKILLDRMQYASPLETTRLLHQMELFDCSSSQAVIDRVYKEFADNEHMKDGLIKPVFLSIIDGLLENTKIGREMRKKGLTGSRLIEECENFSYDTGSSYSNPQDNGYVEYKNAQHDVIEYNIALANYKKNGGEKPKYNGRMNENMTHEYTNNRKLYNDTTKLNHYKKKKLHENGDKYEGMRDEYTGRRDMRFNRGDKHDNKEANTDHIVPLARIHEQFKTNTAFDDSDIKRIANIEDNYALTTAEINKKKNDLSNEEFIEKYGNELSEKTKSTMRQKEKTAKKAIEDKANEIAKNNLLGKGSVNEKTMEAAVNKFKEEHGDKITKAEREKIKNELQREKTKKIYEGIGRQACDQQKDYAIGNALLFIIKPLYYEITDIFKNGFKDGVDADSFGEAIKIRFVRVKEYIVKNIGDFLKNNMADFIKGILSSILEAIINVFTGVLKNILKVVKEGIKIFVNSAKILFGEQGKNMTSRQKGDAIVKLLGGSVTALLGVGIDMLLRTPPFAALAPFAPVISTMLSGIASALFVYALDRMDLFSVKSEMRMNRILDIFAERQKDIDAAIETYDVVQIDTLKKQRQKFELINNEIDEGLKKDDIKVINSGLYKMADFMGVKLAYYNTDEFVEYFDSNLALQL